MKSHITACCLALALAGPLAAAEAPAAGTAPDAAAIQHIKAYCLDFNWAVTDRKRKPFASPGTWAEADPAQHVAWYDRNIAVLARTYHGAPIDSAWIGKDGFVTFTKRESLRRIGSTEGFKPYDGNPILHRI